MHLSPVGNPASPLGLASDYSNAYFSSEFEFFDLKNISFDVSHHIYWKNALNPCGPPT